VLDSCNTVFRDSVYISPNLKNLNISFGSTLCEYDTAKITLPANFTNYSWLPFSNSMQSGNILLLFPTSTTIYTINAQSHNNCFITDTVQIKKKDCYGSMYFPTAFSPNGDAKNDTYKPGAIGILQSYSLIIYNRYGNMVFHTNDINKGWDGKYQNKVQTGGYTWICTYTFRSRQQQTESGSFILLR
jgi:gliding motility-associated-like protein